MQHIIYIRNQLFGLCVCSGKSPEVFKTNLWENEKKSSEELIWTKESVYLRIRPSDFNSIFQGPFAINIMIVYSFDSNNQLHFLWHQFWQWKINWKAITLILKYVFRYRNSPCKGTSRGSHGINITWSRFKYLWSLE